MMIPKRLAARRAGRLTDPGGCADQLTRLHQRTRYLAYAELLRRGVDSGDLTLFELSVFSQNGEDGVLQEIFRRIGTRSRFFIEIGAEVREANGLLLADLLGWSGVFIDADPDRVDELRAKYRGNPRVRVRCSVVTPDNIDRLVADSDSPAEPDLLSVDVDGDDYWIWAACEQIRPRVVVIEFNASLGSVDRRVRPYQGRRWDDSVNFGSSVAALVQLGERKGYRLAHQESSGTNLFFVKAEEWPSLGVSGEVADYRGPNYYLDGRRHPGDPDPSRFVDPGTPDQPGG